MLTYPISRENAYVISIEDVDGERGHSEIVVVILNGLVNGKLEKAGDPTG